ncbi:T9SS type B sorting domain-containing protein, partial [Flavobacterium aurantiibacter]
GITGTWSPALNNTATTTYTFTPAVGQCAATATLTIRVNSPVVLTRINGPNTLCEREVIEFTANQSGGFWSSSDSNIATIDAASGLLRALSPGFVTLTYQISTPCLSVISRTIEIVDLPEVQLPQDLYLCLDNVTGQVISVVEVKTDLSPADYTFSWTLNGDPLTETSNSLLVQVPGIYQVTVTNLVTGCSSLARTEVKTSSLAVAIVSVGDDFDDRQQIVVQVTGGSGSYEYILNDGFVQDSNVFTNIYQGPYNVSVRDKFGCGTVSYSVFALNYPRFITPNGDGYNDYWSIEDPLNQIASDILIFDRYGKLLTTVAPNSVGWDGTFQGKPQVATDYWFTLFYIDQSGNKQEFKAHFALKR